VPLTQQGVLSGTEPLEIKTVIGALPLCRVLCARHRGNIDRAGETYGCLQVGTSYG